MTKYTVPQTLPSAAGGTDVVLVSMPYASVERPSLAIASLCAGLRAAGLRAEAIHANLHFAEEIGLMGYDSINASPFSYRIGEWTFAEAAFPDVDLDAATYLATLSREMGLPDVAARLSPIPPLARRFVETTARRIIALRPKIVGCSSVFQQHNASLALLRRIKALDPTIVTMMGGGNCEGSMGWATLQTAPFVDLVVSGEADALLPPLCRRIIDEAPDLPGDGLPPGVFGPSDRGTSGPPDAARLFARVPTLEAAACPDYDSYFEALDQTAYRRHVVPGLPVETARGCWWGQKHHCAFCGIPTSGLAFRSKPAETVRAELRTLTTRYGIDRVSPADNIVETAYFKTVLPALSRSETPLHLFFQIKANLKRDQVALLADAGARWLQPGIESLSADMLSLLSKGSSAMINLQLLKWARQHGIWLLWHMLHGAPGEQDGWHAETADWLPLIAHFQPPGMPAMTRIEYFRFSPFVTEAERFGLDLVPAWAYAHTLPQPPHLMAHQAYAFTDRRAEQAARAGVPSPGADALNAAIRAWYEGFTHYPDGPIPTMRPDAPTLQAWPHGDSWSVMDSRPCRTRDTHHLGPLAVAVLRACDAAKGRRSLLDAVGDRAAPQDVEQTIASLCAAGLLLDQKGQLLSLVFDAPPRPYPAPHDFPAGQLRSQPLPDDARPWARRGSLSPHPQRPGAPMDAVEPAIPPSRKTEEQYR